MDRRSFTICRAHTGTIAKSARLYIKPDPGTASLWDEVFQDALAVYDANVARDSVANPDRRKFEDVLKDISTYKQLVQLDKIIREWYLDQILLEYVTAENIVKTAPLFVNISTSERKRVMDDHNFRAKVLCYAEKQLPRDVADYGGMMVRDIQKYQAELESKLPQA